MPRDYGEVVQSLTDVEIASYNILTDTVGSAIALPEVQTFEFTPVADTDQIKAQGYVQHLLTVTTHVEFTFGQAGIPYAALAIIAGASNTSSGSEGYLQFDAGGAGLPYFAIAGKLPGEQGDDVHIGIKCCKLDNIPAWSFEQNQFTLGSNSGKGIMPSTSDRLIYIERHETATAIDMTTLFTKQT